MTRKKELIQEAQKKQLLEELAKQPAMVVATAYLYAFNYINYGADVTKEWTTATQQSALLEEAYNKGQHDEMVKAKKAQEQMVEIDLYSVIKQKYIEREVLDKIKAEIDEVYEKLDGYDPHSLDSFAERIDFILDKYKKEGEQK